MQCSNKETIISPVLKESQDQAKKTTPDLKLAHTSSFSSFLSQMQLFLFLKIAPILKFGTYGAKYFSHPLLGS